ncbi:MAG: aminotransferase class IV [Opitutaceae bacterium]|nr:aminotransferase class IV [Opitutaceae bacterium]
MADDILWFNGACRPAAEARIPVADHAVQYGAGLFETFRTWGGRAPLLHRHLARLRAGCRQYRIEFPAGTLLPRAETELPRILQELLARNGREDAVFRYTVTAGEAPPGLPAGPYRRPSEIVTLRALPVPPAGGRSVHVLATRRLAPEFSPRPKSLQYANALAARWEMLDRGLPAGAEGLMLTPEGWLAEGVTTSLFFFNDNRLCTPALDLGVLPGVMREVVLELARKEGMTVSEGTFPLAALAQAEMVFLTSGALGLAPVERIFDAADRLLASPATSRHPWFRRLEQGFRDACVTMAPPRGA